MLFLCFAIVSDEISRDEVMKRQIRMVELNMVSETSRVGERLVSSSSPLPSEDRVASARTTPTAPPAVRGSHDRKSDKAIADAATETSISEITFTDKKPITHKDGSKEDDNLKSNQNKELAAKINMTHHYQLKSKHVLGTDEKKVKKTPLNKSALVSPFTYDQGLHPSGSDAKKNSSKIYSDHRGEQKYVTKHIDECSDLPVNEQSAVEGLSEFPTIVKGTVIEPTSVTANNNFNSFQTSVEKSFDSLTTLEKFETLSNFSHNFGVMGNLLPIIYEKASKMSNNGEEPLKIFDDPDNVTLFNLLQQKLPILKSSMVTGKLIDKIEYCLHTLIEEFKRTSSENILDLDISSIATATRGFSAEQISRFILNKLRSEGKPPPTPEQMRRVGMAVTAKHFDLSMKPEPLNKEFVSESNKARLLPVSKSQESSSLVNANLRPPLLPLSTPPPPLLPQSTYHPSLLPKPKLHPPLLPQPSSQPPLLPQPSSQPSLLPQPSLQPPLLPQPSSQPPLLPQPSSQPPLLPQPSSQPPLLPQPSSQPSLLPQSSSPPPFLPTPNVRLALLPNPVTQPQLLRQPNNQVPQIQEQKPSIVVSKTENQLIPRPKIKGSSLLMGRSEKSFPIRHKIPESVCQKSNIPLIPVKPFDRDYDLKISKPSTSAIKEESNSTRPSENPLLVPPTKEKSVESFSVESLGSDVDLRTINPAAFRNMDIKIPVAFGLDTNEDCTNRGDLDMRVRSDVDSRSLHSSESFHNVNFRDCNREVGSNSLNDYRFSSPDRNVNSSKKSGVVVWESPSFKENRSGDMTQFDTLPNVIAGNKKLNECMPNISTAAPSTQHQQLSGKGHQSEELSCSLANKRQSDSTAKVLSTESLSAANTSNLNETVTNFDTESRSLFQSDTDLRQMQLGPLYYQRNLASNHSSSNCTKDSMRDFSGEGFTSFKDTTERNIPSESTQPEDRFLSSSLHKKSPLSTSPTSSNRPLKSILRNTNRQLSSTESDTIKSSELDANSNTRHSTPGKSQVTQPNRSSQFGVISGPVESSSLTKEISDNKLLPWDNANKDEDSDKDEHNISMTEFIDNEYLTRKKLKMDDPPCDKSHLSIASSSIDDESNFGAIDHSKSFPPLTGAKGDHSDKHMWSNEYIHKQSFENFGQQPAKLSAITYESSTPLASINERSSTTNAKSSLISMPNILQSYTSKTDEYLSKVQTESNSTQPPSNDNLQISLGASFTGNTSPDIIKSGSQEKNKIYDNEEISSMDDTATFIKPLFSPKRKEWKLPDKSSIIPPSSPWQSLSTKSYNEKKYYYTDHSFTASSESSKDTSSFQQFLQRQSELVPTFSVSSMKPQPKVQRQSEVVPTFSVSSMEQQQSVTTEIKEPSTSYDPNEKCYSPSSPIGSSSDSSPGDLQIHFDEHDSEDINIIVNYDKSIKKITTLKSEVEEIAKEPSMTSEDECKEKIDVTSMTNLAETSRVTDSPLPGPSVSCNESKNTSNTGGDSEIDSVDKDETLDIDDMVQLLHNFAELDPEEQEAFSAYLRNLKDKDPNSIKKLYERANMDE